MRTITSARLLLRPWQDDDAAFLLDLESRWEVVRFLGAHPATMKTQEDALASISRRRALDHPVHGIWAITAGGRPVGNLLLKPIPLSGGETSSDVEIGWHLHPDHWGKGYATEAAEAVLHDAFDRGLAKVLAVTDPGNHASQAVCRRLGLTARGRTARYYDTVNELFEILPGEGRPTIRRSEPTDPHADWAEAQSFVASVFPRPLIAVTGQAYAPSVAWQSIATGAAAMTSTLSSHVPAEYAGRELWSAFIGGEWVPVDGAETFTVHEPATGKAIARVLNTSPELVDRAIADSRRAGVAWRALPPRERGRLMRLVAAKIREHVDELAELEARENGKPKRDAGRFDISYSHAAYDYYAGLADTLHGEIIDQGPIEARVIYEPYGVVAAILPFNWPPIHFSKKSAPALAAGNTVVIKPGEQAPLTVLRLVELANEVLPPGVLNAVPGMSAGPALSSHPGVDRITFTGATVTGQRVLRSAAENLTFATMELGGKNALMVLHDADLDVAVDVALEGMFYNQGEACTSTARILVHDSIHDEFLERFARATERLVVGDGLDAATDIGPMVDAAQRDKVLAYLQTGLDEGARLVTQGALPADERLKDGYWVAPTVLADVTPAMTLAQEEIFGPIACVMRFSDEQEAIDVVNGTAYGLTAAMCTVDEGRAYRIAQRLEVGMVFVNNYMRRAFLGSPFGGQKGSGFGRENAIETLHEFVRSKNIRFPSGRGVIPTWPPVD